MRRLGLVLVLCLAGVARAGPRDGLGPVGSSLVSMGSLYAGNVLTAFIVAGVSGSFENSPLNALFIPFAGPFIALGDPRNAPASNAVPLVIDCVAYVGSVVSLVIAIVVEKAFPTASRAWLLMPGAARAPMGATLMITLP